MLIKILLNVVTLTLTNAVLLIFENCVICKSDLFENIFLSQVLQIILAKLFSFLFN